MEKTDTSDGESQLMILTREFIEAKSEIGRIKIERRLKRGEKFDDIVNKDKYIDLVNNICDIFNLDRQYYNLIIERYGYDVLLKKYANNDAGD